MPQTTAGEIEVRFFDHDDPVSVRIGGLDAALLRLAAGHWTAASRHSEPAGRPGPPTLRVVRTDARPRMRRGRTAGGAGDVLFLPGGRLSVHPDRNAVEASLSAVEEADEHLFLDVLDAALALALARQRVLLLHAAAFGHAAGHLLALGSSGSGKSTLASAAIAAGARLLSDDTVLIREAHGRLEAGPFRGHLDFRQDPTATLPASAAARLQRVEAVGGTSWRLDLDALPDRSRAGSLDPDRLWILSVDRRLSRSLCTHLSQSESLAHLMSAASPLVLSPRYKAVRDPLLPVLLTLAERCTAWRVRLAPEVLREPAAALERLLDATS